MVTNKRSLLNTSLSGILAASLLLPTSNALANKENVGTIVGGVVGSILGYHAGSEKNQEQNAFIGTIIGALIGNRIGADLDSRDQAALADAQRRVLESQREQEQVDWRGSDYGSNTGTRGSISTLRVGTHRQTQEMCKEYESIISSRRQTETVRGVACVNRRGQWYEVQTREVTFEKESPDYGTLPSPLPNNSGALPGPLDMGPLPPGYAEAISNSNEATIIGVTRRSRGEVIEIILNSKTPLQRLDIEVLSGNLTLHKTNIQSSRGQMYNSANLSRKTKIPQGSVMYSENLIGIGKIRKIQIQAESIGSTADFRVYLFNTKDKVEVLSVNRALAK